MGYTAKTATKFTGLTRGIEASTATTHIAAKTVTERDISIVMYSRHATLSADTDSPAFPEEYHLAPVYFATAIALKKHKKFNEAKEWERLFDEMVSEAKKDLTVKNRDKYSAVKNEESYGENDLGMI